MLVYFPQSRSFSRACPRCIMVGFSCTWSNTSSVISGRLLKFMLCGQSREGSLLVLSRLFFFFFKLLVVARVVDTLLYPLHFPAYVGIPIKREISFYITFPSNILASDNNYFPLLFSSLLFSISSLLRPCNSDSTSLPSILLSIQKAIKRLSSLSTFQIGYLRFGPTLYCK